MRWLSVVVLLACNHTAAEGHKVVLGDGEQLTVGSVRVDAEQRDEGLFVHMHEGSREDTRLVSGTRVVKFGAHRVWFDENGSNVSVIVRAYSPASPLTSDDALYAADEAMSPKSQGLVECTTATLSPDGRIFSVRCREPARSGSDRTVKVDRLTGAIVSI